MDVKRIVRLGEEVVSGGVSLVTVAGYEHQRMVQRGSQRPWSTRHGGDEPSCFSNNREDNFLPYDLVELAWIFQKRVRKVLSKRNICYKSNNNKEGSYSEAINNDLDFKCTLIIS